LDIDQQPEQRSQVAGDQACSVQSRRLRLEWLRARCSIKAFRA
jgi:hypothetical protein